MSYFPSEQVFAHIYAAPAPTVVQDGTNYAQITGSFVTNVKSGNILIADSTITYFGSSRKYIGIYIAYSMSHTASNVNTYLTVSKNDVLETFSEIQRKIGTGADIGAAGFTTLMEVDHDDNIKLHLKSDDAGTATLNKLSIVLLGVT